MRFGVAQISLDEDIGSNASKMIAYLKSASQLGIDMLCFPECSLTGYVRDFSKLDFKELDRALAYLHREARRYHVNTIVGTALIESGKMFNAAVVLSIDAQRWIYRKHMLTDFDKQYFHPGNGILCFMTGGMGCGVLICRDQDDPWLAKEYQKRDVKLIFYLSAHYYSPPEARNKLDKNRALPIARAVENKLFVAKANAVGTSKGLISLGHSMLINPTGLVLAEGDLMEETILHHQIRT